ncbi:hypothetical protein EUTSA_v10003418mg, partial [Eutrema salsugineum]
TDLELHPIEIGAQVEIKSQDGGWFEGTLINTKDDDYTVEYSHLYADKMTKQKKLLECVKKNLVRPKQPALGNNAKLMDLLREVDTFFNDGWWPGNVVVVKTDNIYGVKMSKFEEIHQIPIKALRRGMEWENGEWIQRENDNQVAESNKTDSTVAAPAKRKVVGDDGGKAKKRSIKNQRATDKESQQDEAFLTRSKHIPVPSQANKTPFREPKQPALIVTPKVNVVIDPFLTPDLRRLTSLDDWKRKTER